MRGSLKKGDSVKLIGVPPDARDDEHLETRTVFEKCLGKVYEIAAIERVAGTSKWVVRLDIGRALGKPADLHTIWVEPEYLEPWGSN